MLHENIYVVILPTTVVELEVVQLELVDTCTPSFVRVYTKVSSRNSKKTLSDPYVTKLGDTYILEDEGRNWFSTKEDAVAFLKNDLMGKITYHEDCITELSLYFNQL